MSRAPTFAPTIARLIGFALSFIGKYLEKNFQQIFKTVLDSKPPPTFASASHKYKNPCKRPLKTRFPTVY